MKVVKRYHLAVITKISTRNVRYNMVNIINSAVCYIRRLSRVNLVLITGENIFFISLVLYLFLTFAQKNIKLEISLWFCISLRLFATPWRAACQALLSMEFSRQEYWSELPFPSPGIEPRSPTLQADSLPLSHQGSPYTVLYVIIVIPQ